MSTENILHTGPFTIVHDEVIKDVGPIAAIVFGKLLNWFQPNKQNRPKLKVNKEGELWLAKSCLEIAQECDLKLKQARTAIDALVEANYLVKKVFLYNKLRTNHFQLGGKGRPFCFFTEPHKRGSAIRGSKYQVDVAPHMAHVPPTTCANRVTPNAPSDPGSALFGVPITLDYTEDKTKENVTVYSNCNFGIVAKEMPEDSLSPFFLSGEETEEEQHSKRLEWEERIRLQVKVPVAVQTPVAVQAPVPVQSNYQQPPPPIPNQATGLGNRTGVQAQPRLPYPGVAGMGGWARQYAHQSHREFGVRGWENSEDEHYPLRGTLTASVKALSGKKNVSEAEAQAVFEEQKRIAGVTGVKGARRVRSDLRL